MLKSGNSRSRLVDVHLVGSFPDPCRYKIISKGDEISCPEKVIRNFPSHNFISPGVKFLSAAPAQLSEGEKFSSPLKLPVHRAAPHAEGPSTPSAVGEGGGRLGGCLYHTRSVSRTPKPPG